MQKNDQESQGKKLISTLN